MKNWLKYGLLIGIPFGIIISFFLLLDNYPSNLIGMPAFKSCMFITQCGGESCIICGFLGPVIAFIFSFIIGAIIGLVIEKRKF